MFFHADRAGSRQQSKWSDGLQIFEAVFNTQLGATRPVAPLTETEKTRLQELVTMHASRLRKVQFTSLEDKLHVRSFYQLFASLSCHALIDDFTPRLPRCLEFLGATRQPLACSFIWTH